MLAAQHPKEATRWQCGTVRMGSTLHMAQVMLRPEVVSLCTGTRRTPVPIFQFHYA
jgi:hypothetical protein